MRGRRAGRAARRRARRRRSQAAEQRRRLAREAALLGSSTAPIRPRSRGERGQHRRHREGDQRGEDGLVTMVRAKDRRGGPTRRTSIHVELPWNPDCPAAQGVSRAEVPRRRPVPRTPVMSPPLAHAYSRPRRRPRAARPATLPRMVAAAAAAVVLAIGAPLGFLVLKVRPSGRRVGHQVRRRTRSETGAAARRVRLQVAAQPSWEQQRRPRPDDGLRGGRRARAGPDRASPDRRRPPL